ncbi:MAG: M28 family peptidase [Bacteroidales bacterium]|nr:M28 family peptidase [Bacteroidales bacterium]MCF8455493.1 M28 family peptidase [Bacteroidales bacterium]
MTRNLITCALALFLSLSTIGQVTIPADSLKKHVYYLASDSLEGRGLSTEGGLKAAIYIANLFKEIGIAPAGEGYFHPFYTRVGQSMLKGNNVVGIIEGTDPKLKNEYIVLGAHYDHLSYTYIDGVKVVYNGADDNASGTSAIIELGRALVQQKEKLKRSVLIIAFDGEESGLRGSIDFIGQNVIPIENVKLMMSIDMVGRYAESNSLIMGAMANLTGGIELLDRIAKKHEVKLKEIPESLSGRTDSKPFGDIGIPAIHVTSGIVGPYHQPEDDRETIDYEGMEKIAGLLFELTIELANKDSLVPNKKLMVAAKQSGQPFFRYGVKAHVGSSFHAYPNEFFNGKRRFSYEVGLVSQIKITKHFLLQPEVLYSSSASDYETGNFRVHSLKIPVSLVIASSGGGYNPRVYATLGAYYRYHFSGTANGKSLDFDNSFEQTETGIVYGFGFEQNSVFVSVNFSLGLSSLAKDANMSDFKNRATYFSMAYMF